MINLFLTKELKFPPIEYATKEGIVAIGGDLSTERLLLAYRSGIFPWYSEGEPIFWWSPDPRFVLFPNEIKVSKSMQKIIKKDTFEIKYNTAFREVICNCRKLRLNKEGTWITNNMVEAYCKLNELGYAHSVETWHEGKLVGGLYGINMGKCFFGESMFSTMDNASKFALIMLAESLKEKKYLLIDCQVYTNHLASMGAREIPRFDFLRIIKEGLLATN